MKEILVNITSLVFAYSFMALGIVSLAINFSLLGIE